MYFIIYSVLVHKCQFYYKDLTQMDRKLSRTSFFIYIEDIYCESVNYFDIIGVHNFTV